DVLEVQAGGGLVEDVEGAARLPLGQLAAELDALGLAAAEGGGRLAELDVVEADVDEGGEDVLELRVALEEAEALLDGGVEDVLDGAVAVADGEGLRVVAPAAADLAGDVDVGEEVHLHLDDAGARAGLAAAALDVEAEAAGLVSAR